MIEIHPDVLNLEESRKPRKSCFHRLKTMEKVYFQIQICDHKLVYGIFHFTSVYFRGNDI